MDGAFLELFMGIACVFFFVVMAGASFAVGLYLHRSRRDDGKPTETQ